MMACFATLNLLFMAAMTLGSAASAILLQYTAPAWILIFGAIFLKEWPRRRDIVVLLGGMCGIVMIVAGTSQEANRVALAAALGSGLAYAAVLLCLRALHDLPSQWLTVLNLSASGLVLLPVVMTESLPSGTQLVWLAVFGVVQFAIPYVLMARALRYVSPLEAGLITLLEPVLNPIWAYLISPQTETPPVATLMGGAIIIGTLAIRYFPAR
jgi:drug/metabolite transporter (DMT)-like permease